MRKRILSLFHNLFRKGAVELELDDELGSSVEILTEEKMKQGLSGSAARREALLELGGIDQVKEEVRAVRAGRMLEDFARDSRLAFRSLRKSPGFTTVAILTLALGIGANTAIFSVVNAVLLHPLPFRQPNRLVLVQEELPLLAHRPIPVPAHDVIVFQKESRVFAAAAGFEDTPVDLTGAGQPERVRAERVSWTLFPILGIQPLLGRTFTSKEDQGGRRVAVLTYGLWKQRFGGDRSIVGRAIDLERKPYTVIGVMPPRFSFAGEGFLEGYSSYSSAALWVPMSFTAEERTTIGDNFNFGLIARLKPGVSLPQVQADANMIATRIQQQYPPSVRNELKLNAVVTPLLEAVVGRVRTLMAILLGAVGLVLLIACVNVAHLLLSRMIGRQKEMAVRLALGAGRARLLRQFIAENVVLALAGGALGTGMAFWCDRVLARLAPSAIPRLHGASIDVFVLLFTLGLSVIVGVLIGAAPAFAAGGTDVNGSLKEGGRSLTAGRRHERLRSALVISEIALALVLLVGAGLLIRSFVRVLGVNPGFQAQHVLTFNVGLPSAAYPRASSVRSFYRELRDRLARLPGVRRVGFATGSPMEANWTRTFVPENYHPAPGAQLNVCFNALVSGNYFQALRIPLIRGRYFNDEDTPHSTPVVIVSQSIAREFWPRENPIGKRLKWGTAADKLPWATIVGVVGDIQPGPLAPDRPSRPSIYEPYSQTDDALVLLESNMHFAVRASGDPASLAAAARAEVWDIDAQLPVTSLETMSAVVAKALAPRRFNLFLLGAFAGLALLLAAIGIYGVISCSASQRTHEIGIRLALGAQRGDIAKLVLREGTKLTLIGVGFGVVAALGLTRLMASLLFGVSPTNPPTFAAVALILTAVALLASYVPARRAMRVDPVTALKHE